mmetsp:Transcript_74937/g.150669  ORF Transcript_74937/g.150669 Transcript_74937/m.150669 type:complete len:81 (-) Transcript_74937:232-474(-)
MAAMAQWHLKSSFFNTEARRAIFCLACHTFKVTSFLHSQNKGEGSDFDTHTHVADKLICPNFDLCSPLYLLQWACSGEWR